MAPLSLQITGSMRESDRIPKRSSAIREWQRRTENSGEGKPLGWHVCRANFGTKDFFGAANFLTKMLRNFPEIFEPLFCGFEKIPQNSRQISHEISLPKIKSKSPTSFCKGAGRTNHTMGLPPPKRKRRDPSVCNPSVCKNMKEHSRNITLGREDIWHTESIATILLGPSRASRNQTSPKTFSLRSLLNLQKEWSKKYTFGRLRQNWKTVMTPPPPRLIIYMFSPVW